MTYDYVVIGAGSAGATLASRLSEDPDVNVLLLEAGNDYPSGETPPDLLDSRQLAARHHTWNYVASPVPGRTIPYPRGKVTGGTSAINATAAQRGRPADFDGWVRRGNPDWTWESVLPYYKKLEADPFGSDVLHGKNGPIPITRYHHDDLVPLQRAFYQTCRATGFADVQDHNALDGPGVGPWPFTRDGTNRVSTALAYLSSARARQNLLIRSETLVDKVLFDGKRAVGIALAGGEVVSAANVVLCAGAVGSPAILLRSGIGPEGDLRDHGIQPVFHSPGVGARLWDHPAVPLRLIPRSGPYVPGRDSRFQVMARFTAAGSAEPEDMQLVMVTWADISGVPELLATAGMPVISALLTALMMPRGYGRLSLASADPSVQPVIELNFGGEVEDMRRLLLGVRLGWKVLRSAPLNAEIDGLVGLGDEVIQSDALLRDYVLGNVGTYGHALGTARMGREDDPGAVVDQSCRVRGVERLWIADASVMPVVIRVVPNLTVIMLAERVADWLRRKGFDDTMSL